MAKKDLFGREKDAERRAAMEREAAEEVERLTRRITPSPGGILGGGLGPGPGSSGNVGPPSDLEMIANSVRERPRGRGATGLGGRAPNPASAFPVGAAMLSGSVGSGFGPAGLSPGPGQRGSGSAVPQGQRSTPSPDYDEPLGGRFGRVDEDDDEEMSITEMALADYAARSGSSLEDVAMQVDVESAEETRDRAMRQFHDRQQNVRRPMAVVTDPFAPAAMRSKSATAAAAAQAKLDAPGGRQRPESAGSALAARIAARRRQDQERSGGPLGGARLASARAGAPSDPEAAPSPPAAAPATSARAVQETSAGALDRLAAKRRAVAPAPEPEVVDEDEDEDEEIEDGEAAAEEPVRLGKLHTQARARTRSPARPRAEPPPAPEPEPAPAAPSPSDPNAHLYEALMEERAARLALEARLEAMAAGAAAPKRAARKPAVAKAPVKRVAARKAAAAKAAPAPTKGRAAKGAVPVRKAAAPAKPVTAKKASAPKKAAAARKAVAKKPATGKTR